MNNVISSVQVNLICRFHPNLLNQHFTSTSPLHLAARNGHSSVVLALITAGFSINTNVRVYVHTCKGI